jgi:arylsulfatase
VVRGVFQRQPPSRPREGIEQRDLSQDAQTINQRGTTIVPLEVKVQADGDIYIRAKDPACATPGPDGRFNGKNPGDAASTVFYGGSWAWLQNTPFRLYKHFSPEGGIASPLIVHCPAGISGRNELRQQPGHLVDIMATVVEVSGASYPGEFNGHVILPMEGRSLVPAFANQPIQREAIFWEPEGNAAIRLGDWKLVRRGGQGAWEL